MKNRTVKFILALVLCLSLILPAFIATAEQENEYLKPYDEPITVTMVHN